MNEKTKLSLLALEDRLTPNSTLTGGEQLFLELVNRARANPVAEAQRFGINLNEGLAPGTISSNPSAALAPNAQLTNAIRAHMQELVARQTLDHSGLNGSTSGSRATAAGYNWNAIGENLAVSTGLGNEQDAATTLHQLLFVDEGYPGRGHRVAMLNPTFKEAGVGLTPGSFRGGNGFYVGQDFGRRSGNSFLTGVVYTDAVVTDQFYTVGEGVGNVSITAVSGGGQTFQTTTGASGGYSLQLPAGTYQVTFTTTTGVSTMQSVTLGSTNQKLDFVTAAGGAAGATLAPPVTSAPLPSTVPVIASGLPNGQYQVFTVTNGQLTPFGSPITPFPGFTGEIRTAVGDVTGDGIFDVVAAAGPGGGARVAVIDGSTGSVIADFFAFEQGFTGGSYVAVGDFNQDGRGDVVVSADRGGGPRVRVFSGANLNQELASFFGIDDPNFRGGARVAVGDFNGDRVADLAVAAGFTGGPRIAVYEGRSVISGAAKPNRFANDFFAYDPGLTNGAYVAAGDVDGDGFADLIFGGGPGGGPHVRILNGRTYTSLGGDAALANPIGNYFAGDSSTTGGVRVAVRDVDQDGRMDVLTGIGQGSRMSVFVGRDFALSLAPREFLGVDAFPGFLGGVLVG